MKMGIVEIIGWLGAGLLLTGFTLNLFNKISVDSLSYLMLNIAGSILLLINAYLNEIYPFVIVNFFWVAASGYRIVEILVKDDASADKIQIDKM